MNTLIATPENSDETYDFEGNLVLEINPTKLSYDDLLLYIENDIESQKHRKTSAIKPNRQPIRCSIPRVNLRSVSALVNKVETSAEFFSWLKSHRIDPTIDINHEILEVLFDRGLITSAEYSHLYDTWYDDNAYNMLGNYSFIQLKTGLPE